MRIELPVRDIARETVYRDRPDLIHWFRAYDVFARLVPVKADLLARRPSKDHHKNDDEYKENDATDAKVKSPINILAGEHAET